MILDLDQTADFGSVTFPVNKTILTKELKTRTRDFQENYNFSLIFIPADLDPLPVRGDLVTWDGIEFRVMDIDESPDDVTSRIHLESKYSTFSSGG